MDQTQFTLYYGGVYVCGFLLSVPQFQIRNPTDTVEANWLLLVGHKVALKSLDWEKKKRNERMNEHNLNETYHNQHTNLKQQLNFGRIEFKSPIKKSIQKMWLWLEFNGNIINFIPLTEKK